MEHIPSIAPRFRLYWLEKNRIAVSPMPRPDDVEEIISMFNTIVSLATPIEHVYGGGYDPRSLGSTVKLVWRPIGEYNAPTLPELAYIIRRIDEPALVHCFRGCGRSSVVAAAWLVKRKGVPSIVAESEVITVTGCGIETLPQRAVLQAYSLAIRAGLEDKLYKLDLDDPRVEYALLFSRELAVYLSRTPEELAIESLMHGTPLYKAASLLASMMGYSVAGISSKKMPDGVEIEITVWLPRRSHPAAIRRSVRIDYERVSMDISKALQSLGLKISVMINVKDPRDVPWV